MGKSDYRCKTPNCTGILGAVDRFSKALRPAQGVIAIGHGPNVTMVCPVCGKPRVFTGWTMAIQKRPASVTGS